MTPLVSLLSLCCLRIFCRFRKNQRRKVFVINSLITSFFMRSCCLTYKRLVVLFFVFMHVQGMDKIWICWVFALTWQSLHVSLGDQIDHSILSKADTSDSSGPTQCVPPRRGNKPKAGHVTAVRPEHRYDRRAKGMPAGTAG